VRALFFALLLADPPVELGLCLLDILLHLQLVLGMCFGTCLRAFYRHVYLFLGCGAVSSGTVPKGVILGQKGLAFPLGTWDRFIRYTVWQELLWRMNAT